MNHMSQKQHFSDTYRDHVPGSAEYLRLAPDWLLRYIAPMQCGEKERVELARRHREQRALRPDSQINAALRTIERTAKNGRIRK